MAKKKIAGSIEVQSGVGPPWTFATSNSHPKQSNLHSGGSNCRLWVERRTNAHAWAHRDRNQLESLKENLLD